MTDLQAASSSAYPQPRYPDDGEGGFAGDAEVTVFWPAVRACWDESQQAWSLSDLV